MIERASRTEDLEDTHRGDITSWVPDFEKSSESRLGFFSTLYNASLHLPTPSDILAHPDPGVLYLQGIFIDNITILQPQYTLKSAWSHRDRDAELQWLFELIRFEYIPSTYPDGECGFTAFWRALLRDLSGPT